MKPIQGYRLIQPSDLHWRPSNLSDETLTVPRYAGVLAGPDQLRQAS